MGLEQFGHPDPLILPAAEETHRVEANCSFLERNQIGDGARHELAIAKQSIGASRITIERDRDFVLADCVLAIAKCP
jgi:hypothetical protein